MAWPPVDDLLVTSLGLVNQSMFPLKLVATPSNKTPIFSGHAESCCDYGRCKTMCRRKRNEKWTRIGLVVKWSNGMGHILVQMHMQAGLTWQIIGRNHWLKKQKIKIKLLMLTWKEKQRHLIHFAEGQSWSSFIWLRCSQQFEKESLGCSHECQCTSAAWPRTREERARSFRKFAAVACLFPDSPVPAAFSYKASAPLPS